MCFLLINLQSKKIIIVNICSSNYGGLSDLKPDVTETYKVALQSFEALSPHLTFRNLASSI